MKVADHSKSSGGEVSFFRWRFECKTVTRCLAEDRCKDGMLSVKREEGPAIRVNYSGLNQRVESGLEVEKRPTFPNRILPRKVRASAIVHCLERRCGQEPCEP